MILNILTIIVVSINVYNIIKIIQRISVLEKILGVTEYTQIITDENGKIISRDQMIPGKFYFTNRDGGI